MPIKDTKWTGTHFIVSTNAAAITSSRFNSEKWSKMVQTMVNRRHFVEILETVWPWVMRPHTMNRLFSRMRWALWQKEIPFGQRVASYKLTKITCVVGRTILRCIAVPKPFTPAMAAGITDHERTTSEFLPYRMPAQFLVQLPKIKPLFASPDEVHHGK
jgi:hypothetical protein